MGQDVRVVHFKNANKPWRIPSPCASTRLGTLLLQGGPQLDGVPDDISWMRKGCCSVRRKQLVTWADGTEIPRVCCSHETLLRAQWHGLAKGFDSLAPLPSMSTQTLRKRLKLHAKGFQKRGIQK